MAEVVFITPSFKGSISENFIGTILLTAILKNNGVDTEILGFHNFGELDDFDTFLQKSVEVIKAKAPRIVSFYTRCDTYHITLKLANTIKENFKDIYIVFGGPQSDLLAEETMINMPFVDFICCGEGETTVYPFFSSLIKGTPDLTVPGLVFRRGDAIVKNPRPAMIEDLNSVPEPDYSLFLKEIREDVYKDERFPVDVGRGCPFACTYCSTKTFWNRKYRLKSAERIVKEIKDAHDLLGVTKFSFLHDMFTLDRKTVLKVCELLKDIGFPINWGCSARADCLDNELIDAMVDAGMQKIYIGVETGSPRMQKIINKNLKLDGVAELFKYINSKGIIAKASLIFGFPDETEEDFSQTIAFLASIVGYPNVLIKVNMCTFFPGTEMTAQYQDKLSRASVITNQTYDHGVAACNDIINAYPTLFPQFREYKTELRDKMEFFPYFFKCWRVMRPIYDYISKKYEKDKLCDMFFTFSESNAEIMATGVKPIEVLKNDKFIDRFKDDKKYTVMKEVARYLLWRMKGYPTKLEVFGFDVKSFKETHCIENLEEKLTFVSVRKKEDGTVDFTYKS